jgi:RecB family exonuclease
MNLPENFYYSQNKLQDYLDCPRRFELKYILKQAWPAIRSEPIREIEHHQRLGNQFHLFIQQYFNGLSLESIQKQTTDPVLLQWWRSFELFSKTIQFEKAFPEFQISAQIGKFRFYGVIDLITTDQNGNIVIYDWKTNKIKPSRTTLNQKIQTRLYRLMSALNYERFYPNLPFSPEKIRMEYWFVNDPAATMVFPYDETLFLSDQSFFNQLIETIQNTGENSFVKTEDQNRCKFCNYRSLCARGIQAGVISSFDELPESEDLLDLDLNELTELEF